MPEALLNMVKKKQLTELTAEGEGHGLAAFGKETYK